jgi:nicotinic acetylcholine receptor
MCKLSDAVSALLPTSSSLQVDLRHITNNGENGESDETEMGIDLQDYYISVEWDIMKVPAKRSEKYYREVS